MKKILMMMVVASVLFIGIHTESFAVGPGVVKQNGKIVCISASGGCTVTNKDGTTTEYPTMANAKAETSMIGSAPAMNTLSLSEYTVVENFFIYDGPNTGEGFGVVGGRLYTKINGDCFVDPQYFYVLQTSSTYVTHAAWLSAIGQ